MFFFSGKERKQLGIKILQNIENLHGGTTQIFDKVVRSGRDGRYQANSRHRSISYKSNDTQKIP